MKRILLALLILTGCAKDYSLDNTESIIPDLQVEGEIGLSFYNSTITDTDLFNIKSPINTTYTLEVKDVFDNLITKSTLKANAGNNVYAFYTNAFKAGHYTISVYHNGELIAETNQTIL
jgi:hypothetical protein